MNDELIPEKDERIHLLDRGRSRDMGRNPTFDGSKQRGINPSFAESIENAVSVGDAFERNDRVHSFAATPIAFGATPGQVAEGAGALKGFQVRCAYANAATETVQVNFRDRNAIGAIIASAMVYPGTNSPASLLYTLPPSDFGINFDSLYVEFILVSTGLPMAGAYSVSGTVWVASIE